MIPLVLPYVTSGLPSEESRIFVTFLFPASSGMLVHGWYRANVSRTKQVTQVYLLISSTTWTSSPQRFCSEDFVNQKRPFSFTLPIAIQSDFKDELKYHLPHKADI